jgi:hypothetical protein
MKLTLCNPHIHKMIFATPTCLKYLNCDPTDYDDLDAFFFNLAWTGKETD